MTPDQITAPDKVEKEQIAFILDRVESAANQEKVAIERTQALERDTIRALFTRGLRSKAPSLARLKVS